MNTIARIPRRMTVASFQDWGPPAHLRQRRWQLFDGEPRCMSLARVRHGAIQGEAAVLIGLHLRTARPSCRVIIAPGLIPQVRAQFNQRIPDLGVTCGPMVNETVLADPVLLIEILSPSNERDTRANVWAYTSIPSVQDILLLASTPVGAEVLSRGTDGHWPASPLLLTGEDELRLPGIGFAAPLRAFYVGTSLR
jgi:Uma2 family endonuclease